MTKPDKSIYQRAGEWGVPFGLYLSCAAVASIFSDVFPPLGYVFFILLLGTPVVVYAFQRHRFVEENGFAEHASLWMLGILLFILGTVIASFVVYMVLQYIRPGFLYEQAQAAIDAYNKLPQMRDSDMVKVLQRMLDEKLIPSPIEMVFSTFWFITFGGSIVSAITAAIARRPIKKTF